jgi:glycosyltransferase involved in cell wall biosynthesis
MPANNDKPLKVCYFGTYRENYSRNQMMIAGLRMNGAIVTECHETLWYGIEDRVRVVSGEWLNPRFWWRVFRVYWRLIKKYRGIGAYDVLVTGYPGQFDVYLARILSWLKHRPLVWDVFMSIYLITIERRLDTRNKISTRLLKLIESIALRLPDRLILDTSEYVEWFRRTYGTKTERFRLVPTGADDRIFFPLDNVQNGNEQFTVLYSGTFIPNHGVMYMVDAARLLNNEPAIQFEFIGKGPELGKAKEFAVKHQLTNIKFIDWMEKEQLKLCMGKADICLGAFGTTPQSMMTVQNKIYETIAMRRPLISGDSPAMRQVFTHGENIFLCERGNGKAIAESIDTLWSDPPLRNRIAQNGYSLYNKEYCLPVNGMRFKTYLSELSQ